VSKEGEMKKADSGFGSDMDSSWHWHKRRRGLPAVLAQKTKITSPRLSPGIQLSTMEINNIRIMAPLA
jgi:hypothetical protein